MEDIDAFWRAMYHESMEAIRFEATVGQDGAVYVPDVQVGERVEVIVFKLSASQTAQRKGGWIKGKIEIHTDFDAPIPGMEEYQ